MFWSPSSSEPLCDNTESISLWALNSFSGAPRHPQTDNMAHRSNELMSKHIYLCDKKEKRNVFVLTSFFVKQYYWSQQNPDHNLKLHYCENQFVRCDEARRAEKILLKSKFLFFKSLFFRQEVSNETESSQIKNSIRSLNNKEHNGIRQAVNAFKWAKGWNI